MKRLLVCLFVFVAVHAHGYNNIWQQVDAQGVPAKGAPFTRAVQYKVFSLDINYMKSMLAALSTDPGQAQVIELPMPDGTYRAFNVWQSTMMEPGLAKAYPQIKTFTGTAVGNARVTAKIDFTLRGFHAIIFDGTNTSFIDPYNLQDDHYYIVHYQQDEVLPANQVSVCQFKNGDENGPAGVATVVGNNPLQQLSKIASGYNSHTYRLALACSHQYAAAATGMANPTVADVLSAMTTSMNRINGVYEREFSITMVLVANDTNLIYLPSYAYDPYSAINTNPSSLLFENQHICDSTIGNANYDLGHVFTTAGGGLSMLGCICRSGIKAESETGLPTPTGDGFDIDFVAHEMGHEFGANHPFNNGSDGSCGGGNINPSTAYEPGSGSTIMAYAGICSPDDIQRHSDAYFHAVNLTEIYNYSIVGSGSSCAVIASTGNTPAGLPSFSATYAIPYKTPFELTAPAATDSIADTSNTYCWEEWNLGEAGSRLYNTHFAGPIFRSFSPDTSLTRVFPMLDSILVGTYSYASNSVNSHYEYHEGEKVPDTARFLTFRLTERAVYQGLGSFIFPSDSVHLNVINIGSPFSVAILDSADNYWQVGTMHTVLWNVASTNIAPINCDSVYVYLSTDGGHTWTYNLGEYPNTGSAIITVPANAITYAARIKVKGANNVFFNVNRQNFNINTYPLSVTSVALNNVKVYPSPATGMLYISGSYLNAVIYNALGQKMYANAVDGNISVPVASWAKGIYYVQLTDTKNGQRIVKSVVVE